MESCKEMTDAQLLEWREELRDRALELESKLIAIEEEIADRKRND